MVSMVQIFRLIINCEKKNEKTSSKPSELYITPGRLKLLTTPLSAGVRGPGTQHTPMLGSGREQRC